MGVLTNPTMTGLGGGLSGINNFATPLSRGVLNLATAYQATDPTKTSVMYVTLNSVASLSLAVGTSISGEVRIGPAADVATGGGILVGQYKNSLTGTITIGLNLQTESNSTISFLLPIGWYFAIRQTVGTGLNVTSVYDQAGT